MKITIITIITVLSLFCYCVKSNIKCGEKWYELEAGGKQPTADIVIGEYHYHYNFFLFPEGLFITPNENSK